MHGTRDAPMIWQDHLRKTLLDMKFKESVSHPGVFQHETSNIFLCVHVDDFLLTGRREDLLRLEKQLRRKCELETMLMVGDDDMEKQAVYLGRTMEWRERERCIGVPHQRHVRLVLRELGMENCRSVFTPLSTTMEREGHQSDQPEMSAELATRHRAAVALFRERVAMCALNVLHDISSVILTTCNGTRHRKRQTQLFQPRTPSGPLVENHADRILEGLCRWETISSLRGTGTTAHCTEFWRGRTARRNARNFRNSVVRSHDA